MRRDNNQDNKSKSLNVEQRQVLGKRGENIAAQWLREMNYEVIIQNYRCRQGEIDIIATKDCELIFVEVRSLSGNQDPLRAIASVNKHKQKRMLVAANHYLSQFPPSPLINIRFDVIGISFHADLSMTCHHLPNAIQSC